MSILIDYNGVAVAGAISGARYGNDQGEDSIRHSILNSIRTHRAKHVAKCGEVVICCDARNYWRKESFPQYKAKRKQAMDDSKQDWDELFRCIELVLNELQDNFPYKVVRVDRCEADDIIGVLCEQTQDFGKYEQMMIISGDKDFAQLQKYSNVQQYAPVQRKFIKEDNAQEFLAEHILTGDRIDGIPNVLSADNCFVEGTRQTPLRQPVIKKLLADPQSMGPDVARNILRNKRLIDLSETPDPLKREIINNYDSQDASANSGKVLNYLIDKRCRLLTEVAGDFI
jgi:hypothetical protein